MQFLIHFLVIIQMFQNTIGIDIFLRINITAVVGTNETKLECVFTRENINFIFTVEIQAKTESTNTFENIAVFRPNKETVLEDAGKFLKGREVFTDINNTSTKAVLRILNLKCTDQREYRCKIKYVRSNDSITTNKTSTSNFLTAQAPPSKPNKIEIFTEDTKKRDAFQGLEEGDTIICTCSGNVGSQNGTFIWKIRFSTGNVVQLQSITTLTESDGKCEYFGTSNISIILGVEHNNATVQCVERSQVSFDNMYEETKHIIVLYQVRNTTIQKQPDKIAYEKGIPEINLRCNGDGNPKPTYTWRKDNEVLGNNSEYTISNISTNTSGLYICISKNAINGNVFVLNATVNIMVLANEDQVELTEKPISDGDDSNKGFVSAIIGAAVGCIVIIVIAASVVVYFIRKRKHNEESNDAGNERQTRRTISSDNYDSVDMEDGTDMRQRRLTSYAENDKNGLRYQIEAEQNDTSRLPNPTVEYAVVNKAAKKRNNGENKQSKLYEDHNVSSTEGVYDTSGNPRHKPEKFCEEFDRAADCKWEKKETLEDHYATSSEGVYDVSGNPRHKPTEQKEKFDEMSKEITE